ncbi:MAG: hypothetical protein JSR33_06375, partial [Proteobacteria bacterium]|nr:hypothetical protein [Pseudomonadota bacterium]
MKRTGLSNFFYFYLLLQDIYQALCQDLNNNSSYNGTNHTGNSTSSHNNTDVTTKNAAITATVGFAGVIFGGLILYCGNKKFNADRLAEDQRQFNEKMRSSNIELAIKKQDLALKIAEFEWKRGNPVNTTAITQALNRIPDLVDELGTIPMNNDQKLTDFNEHIEQPYERTTPLKMKMKKPTMQVSSSGSMPGAVNQLDQVTLDSEDTQLLDDESITPSMEMKRIKPPAMQVPSNNIPRT